MSAEARGTPVIAALETDQAAGRERDQQMLQYDKVLVVHRRSVAKPPPTENARERLIRRD
jgi:hypothetical protein